MKTITKHFKREHTALFAILLFIFVMRFPSLFEPFWYGDEGIFAAVARNLNLGGVLYDTAWDNKPPMIYLTYQAIFKFLGVSMFWLRLVTIIAVISTAAIIYEIAEAMIGIKRALAAAFAFGLLTSLRLIEGNLALTEIYMILPIALAMMVAVKRKFDYLSLFVAGLLFAIGSLYKQVGALEAAALGIYLFFISDNFFSFIKKGFVLTLGFTVPYAAAVVYFAPKNLLHEYIFAAYTYYQIYLDESPQYQIFINISKILPIAAVFCYGLWKKYKLKKVDDGQLFILWAAFSLLGSYFSGRTYGHYLVQAVPAVSLLIASISWPLKLNRARIVFAASFFIPLFILTRLLFSDFISGGPINQIKYWGNFIAYAYGNKGLSEYNDFFDGNVNTIMALADSIEQSGLRGETIYIWGDFPWLYAIADAWNPSRYVTSFHVFGVPNGKEEVMHDIDAKLPALIIKSEHSIGYFEKLEMLIATRYTLVAKVETAEVYRRSN